MSVFSPRLALKHKQLLGFVVLLTPGVLSLRTQGRLAGDATPWVPV